MSLHFKKLNKIARKKGKIKALDEIYCYAFDLQTALPFPEISTSIDYYKRNLHVNNLGVHFFNSTVGYVHV